MAYLPRTSVYFWLTLLALCSLQCLAGKPTTATAHHRWSLAELSVTSSELPKQIPAPPYPVLQQRVQSTPHYDQQLKLPSGNGVDVGPRRRHHYPWTQPTSSMSWTDSLLTAQDLRYNRLTTKWSNRKLYTPTAAVLNIYVLTDEKLHKSANVTANKTAGYIVGSVGIYV